MNKLVTTLLAAATGALTLATPAAARPALRLKSRANALGYSDAEIRAYIESDAEKARMRAKGEAFLSQNGVRYGQPETFCAFGRSEIQKNSAIGALLRAN